jgi:hypothetical protein
MSPRVAAGWLKQHTWHCLHMRHNHFMFGRNRALKKGPLFLRPNKFLVPIWPHCSGVSQNITPGTRSPFATTTARLVEIGQYWRALYFWGRNFFFPVSPRIATRWLKYHTCHSHPMRHKHCTFGWHLVETKGTLVLRPKQFFVPLSLRVAAGWLKHHT